MNISRTMHCSRRTADHFQQPVFKLTAQISQHEWAHRGDQKEPCLSMEAFDWHTIFHNMADHNSSTCKLQYTDIQPDTYTCYQGAGCHVQSRLCWGQSLINVQKTIKINIKQHLLCIYRLYTNASDAADLHGCTGCRVLTLTSTCTSRAGSGCSS